MVGARVRRQQVAYAEGRGLSRRRACALLSVARSTLGYVSRLIARDAPCVPAMRTLAGAVSAVRLPDDPDLPRAPGPRDERRPHVSALAAGGAASAEEAAAPPRGDQPPAAAAADGGQSRLGVRLRVRHVRRRPQLKCLTVIDEFTRECLAIDVAGGIRSGRVIEVLTQLVSVHGAPRYLRSDNGPEFVARAILRWLQTAQIETAFIDPGKPWQNGTDESFNGKFRDEYLSLQWFRNRADAKVGIEAVAAALQRGAAALEPRLLDAGWSSRRNILPIRLTGGARRRCRLALT